MILGKYNQAKTITFDLFEIDGVDLSIAATFEAGDVKIMEDEGVEVNTTNLPTDEGSSYSLVLTAAEMSAARIRIILIDQTATKIWLDATVGVETYGNASAEHAFDLDTSSVAQTADHTAAIADVPNNSEFNARTLAAAAYFDPIADTVVNVTNVATTSTVTDGAKASVVTETRLSELDAVTAGKMANQVDEIRTDTGEIGAAGAGLTEAGGTGDHLTAIDLPNQIMNITGNLSGSVGSVTNDVGITQAAADKVWVTTARALTDKAGFSISGTKQTLDALVDLSTTDIDARLAAIGLDHLIAVAVTGTDIVDNSIIAKMVSKAVTADWDTYNNTTDALEALRDRGDSAWITGAGGTPPDLLQNTTIATLTSQTVFTLTAGSSDNTAYDGQIAIITDATTSEQKAVADISGYVGATKEITLTADPAVFTMAVGDSIDIIAATGTAGSGATAAQVWAYAARTLTANTNLNDLSAAEIRTALGLATANLDTQLTTAQNDLDKLTGIDGATLATTQPNYAPAKAGDDMGLTATATSTQLIEDIFNEVLSKAKYNTGQSLAKIIREISAWAAAEGSVTGTPTTTVVATNLLGYDTDFFRDQSFFAYDGAAQAGQSRVVTGYNTDGTFTFDEPFTTALTAGDDIIITSAHVHGVTELAETVRSEMDSSSTRLANISAKTTNLPVDPASETNVDATEAKVDLVAIDVTAIKAKTDNLPVDPASETNVNATETKLDALITTVDSIQGDITLLKGGTVEKNTAGAILVLILDSTGNPVTSTAVTGLRKIDTGAFAAMSAVISVTDAYGYCHVAYTAADVNGTDTVAFRFTAAGANDSHLTLQLT